MELVSVLPFVWIILALSSIAALIPVIIFITRILLFPLTAKGKTIHKMVDPLPGPPLLPVLGNSLDVLVPREQLPNLLDSYNKKYFPIYKWWSFSKPNVFPLGPEYVEAILHSSKNIEKSKMYNLLHPWLGSGLLTSKGNKWFSHRKILTPAFHFKMLQKFIPIFLEKSEILVKKLSTKEVEGKPFNVVPYISQSALEIICESAMGIKLDGNSHLKYFDAIYTLGEIICYRAVRPWLYMEWLFALTPSAFKQRKCLKTLHDFTDKVIQEKKQEYLKRKNQRQTEDVAPKKRKVKAFLDLLIELSIEENLLTDIEIREEVDTFMFEGHDTTSVAICWTLFCLANNPDIQEKVYEEIERCMKGRNEELNQEEEESMANTFNEMQLMERCIKESLRIYPSVPLISRKLTEDLKMGEFMIPRGSMIQIYIRSIHQNPEIYPKPEVFNPDRFLPDSVHARHPYAYIPFSAGPRNCIGQRFAMLEMKSVIATILHNYRVIAVSKPEDTSIIIDLVLRSANGIYIKLERRIN